MVQTQDLLPSYCFGSPRAGGGRARCRGAVPAPAPTPARTLGRLPGVLVLLATLALLSPWTPALADEDADDRCRFPREWKGRWFQSGLGEVLVRERVITRGLQRMSCYEHHRDMYLLENKEEGCYQCMLMMKRHKNLIQYKESFCFPPDSLKNICALIRVESPLYTLVKEASTPIRCPFQDAYYFDYNDVFSATGFCGQPLSSARPCVGQQKYQYHFQHCQPYAMLNGQDLDFECLATWKDGSETYLYGQFSGVGVANKDASYRCFKYEAYGGDVYLSMSGDATCLGLRSAKDGPLIMRFAKDIYGWPQPSCEFPDWLAGVTWRDLEGKHVYSLDDERRVLLGDYRRKASAEPLLQTEFRCVEIVEDNSHRSEPTVIVLSFTTHNCMSKSQCLKFKKKYGNIIEFSQGALVDNFESSRQCLDDDSYIQSKLLMDNHARAIPCPNQGNFLLESTSGCQEYLSVGCANATYLAAYSDCSHIKPFALQCLHQWDDGSRQFLLAGQIGGDSRLVNCFSFREKDGAIQFATDKKCSDGIPNILDRTLRYTLISREQCPLHPVGWLPAQPDPPTSGPDTDGEGEEDGWDQGGEEEDDDEEDAEGEEYGRGGQNPTAKNPDEDSVDHVIDKPRTTTYAADWLFHGYDEGGGGAGFDTNEGEEYFYDIGDDVISDVISDPHQQNPRFGSSTVFPVDVDSDQGTGPGGRPSREKDVGYGRDDTRRDPGQPYPKYSVDGGGGGGGGGGDTGGGQSHRGGLVGSSPSHSPFPSLLLGTAVYVIHALYLRMRR